MKIDFYVNGRYEMEFLNLNEFETPVDDEETQGILDNLQQGEYVVSMDRNKIFDINDLESPVYGFVLDATTDMEYEFDNL